MYMKRILSLFAAIAACALVPALAQSLTLREAYEVALPLAQEWSPVAGLYQAHSADLENDPDPRAGLDGKRRHWYLDFSRPDLVGFSNTPETNTETIFTVEIIDGKPVGTFNSINPVDWALIDPAEIPDSAALAAQAQKAGLEASDFFAYGYHFDLFRNQSQVMGQPRLQDATEGAVFLEITGRRAPGVLPQDVAQAAGAASLSHLYFTPKGQLSQEVN